jgi:gamma-glutamylcyclotransferase (GGCT)/AIG2-like uncharacterized protein YtfP
MEIEPPIHTLTREQLNDALIRLNILRTREPRDPVALDLLEGALDSLFFVSQHLIAYGTLAPGGPNHGLLADLRGEWRKGWVTGELLEKGWSAAMSYPALRWCPEGANIPAHIFVSPDLPAYWRRLDDFEGLEYSRILAPFWTPDGQVLVGNVYAMECDLGAVGKQP